MFAGMTEHGNGSYTSSFDERLEKGSIGASATHATLFGSDLRVDHQEDDSPYPEVRSAVGEFDLEPIRVALH